MKYKVDYTDQAFKTLEKMDKYTRTLIYAWIDKNLYECENPRLIGKPLKGNKKGQWRYRIGDYRLIAKIEDDRLIILIIKIGHIREVYK